MSFYTASNVELLYASTSPGTAKSSFTTEAQINDTVGMGVQAHLPADFWFPNRSQTGRGIGIVARGLMSSTASPTFTFTIRAGVTGNTTSAILLSTAALNGANNAAQIWELRGEVIMTAMGAAGVNSTVQGVGLLLSPGLTTIVNPVFGNAASPGTVTSVDTSVTNYINVNCACSVSNASNTVQLLQLLVYGLN